VAGNVRKLRDEITDGRIRSLQENTPDQMFWNDVSLPYFNRTWLDVPWYWAEAYFYRRVLEATQYFQPCTTYHYDPYTPSKTAELLPDAAPRLLELRLDTLPVNLIDRITRLLESSLWGNRTDLSYNVANDLKLGDSSHDETTNLIVNDAPKTIEWLLSGRCKHLAMIADNAGTELYMDLALIDFLLGQKLIETVVLYLKEQPTFVSDAMPKDVYVGLCAMNAGRPSLQQLATRLKHAIDSHQLILSQHWFFTTSLYYTQLPDDLRVEFARADLVIIKGDANYRRLLSDAQWLPITSFVRATGYFPAPFVALRTMKSELICGLPEGTAEHLTILDSSWRVNGKRGVIQSNLP
ncbi:MAG TPA: damage-control phosphatase ARMT1 family protein, partial [Anaerolineae bacterium]|jgi:uncharacterized protein with ATP-grasp and redox domains